MTKEQLETLKRIAEPLMEGSKYRDAIEAAIEVIEPIMAGFGYADPKQAGIKKDKFNDGLITRESVLFGKMNTKPEDMSEYQKGWNDAIRGSINAIKHHVPSEQPEIIRCKDCKWWDKSEDSPFGYCMAMKHGYMSTNWEIGIYRKYKGDFYCADAERRTDEAD